MLLELAPREDPVTVFLGSQHNHIISLMNASRDTAMSKVGSARTISNLRPRTDKDRARDIQACLRQVGKGEPNFDRSMGSSTWRAILHLVRSVSEDLVQTLPSFWRVCKDQSEGKYHKSQAPGIQSKAKTWASEAIELYIHHLTSFFNLTDMAILTRQPLSPLPGWLPPNTCSMTAAHYMHLILQELAETVNALSAMKIGQTASMLKTFLSNARFCFVEVLCNLWQTDAKIFHLLEDWTINPDEQSTTLYLKDLTAFHRSNARAAYHIASGRGSDPAESSRSKDTGVPAESTARIKGAFLDALYAFLDGIVHLAFAEYDPLDPTITTSHKVVGNSRLTVDVQELDTRILLSVTNLAHLNKILIPTMAKQLQEVFHCRMSEDLATVDEVAHQLDQILFQDFVKRRLEAVSSVFRNGILHSGIDWQSATRPSGVHSFIYEALLALVQVHAQVQSVAKPLINRTISTLLEGLTQVILESFQQVQQFSMGGMLQATLEVEFVHQTLNAFVSQTAEATLKQIYEVVSQKSQQQQKEVDADVLAKELDEVKRTLISSRKMTALEFLCFRKSGGSSGSSSSSASGGRSRPTPTSAGSTGSVPGTGATPTSNGSGSASAPTPQSGDWRRIAK